MSGTPFYSSPEQLRGGFQTRNSDSWSIGCIFYQLLNGRLPFKGPKREDLIEQQKREISAKKFNQNVSKETISLI
jgi:serine/threonine protein kinase